MRVAVITHDGKSVGPLYPGYPWGLRIFSGEGDHLKSQVFTMPWGYGWGWGCRWRGFGYGRGWGYGRRWGYGRGLGGFGQGWGSFGHEFWPGLGDVDAVIVSDADPWFARELEATGIRVIRTDRRDAEDAVREFLGGEA